MSRKLIHSIRAFAVTVGVLAVGFAIGIPATHLDTTSGVTNAPPIEVSEIEAATVSTQQSSAVEPAPTKPHQRRRRARDEMALPFFSFAHVLRRGNGS